MNLYNAVVLTFSVGVIIQLCYYVLCYRRLAFFKKQDNNRAQEPLSIIICARNEASNLLAFLPVVMGQRYPEFEVIVVNDCSLDETEDVLRAFQEKYDNLKVTHVKESNTFNGGKKFALTIGIKAAQYEKVVLTDADCIPKSDDWLTEIAAGYSPETDIVLGYGGYMKEKGLLNKIVRFDTFNIALQYLSFALSGNPYMGVGRNLSYNKQLFFKNKGFASHQMLRSGDDDLFINEVATNKNTNVVINKLGHTESVPKRTFVEWFLQKKRHLTTGAKYKLKHKILLTLWPLSYLLMLVGFALSMVFQIEPEIVVSAFVFRMMVQFIIYFKTMDRLEEKDLLVFAPFMEFVLTFVYPLIYLSSLIQTENKWKN